MTEDEMVGWHHRLDGHEFEQTLGVGVGQGSLACYSPWGCKESDMTERLSLGPIGGKQYNWWKACFNISQMNEMNIKTQAAIRRDKLED